MEGDFEVKQLTPQEDLLLNGVPLPEITPEPGGSSIRGPHRMGAFLLCSQKGAYRYIDRIVPKKRAEVPTFGSMIHLRQAFYWASRLVALEMEPPEWFWTFDLEAALEEEARGYPHLLEEVDKLMKAFTEEYETDTWVPIAVEEEFRCALQDIKPDCAEHLRREVVSFRGDLVVRNQRGYDIPVDYKSVANSWSGDLPRWDPDGKFKIDWQIGCILTILPLVRPDLNIDISIIQRILQKPPYSSDRHSVRCPKTFLSTVPDMMEMALAEDYRTAHEGPRKDGYPRGACFMGWSASDERPAPGRPCEYRDLCLSESEKERDQLIQLGYKERT